MLIDIGWLILALFLVTAAAHSAQLRKEATRRGMTIAFFVVLIAWIISALGVKAFRGSETSLAGFLVFGLLLLAIGEIFAAKNPRLAAWSPAAVPLAAVAFALGFDVFRPDPYSYVPAAILGVLVLFVGWSAYARLSKGAKKAGSEVRPELLLYISAITLLVYSALFKMIDRGWSMPWAYLVSAGALLFAASQLWLGWEKILKEKNAPEWLRLAVGNFAILSMVVAALFVYRNFL